MLTDTDREMLTFERQRWGHAGAKESAIRERFGLSASVYYAELHRLLGDPEAEATDAQLVRRLRRLREGGSRFDESGWRSSPSTAVSATPHCVRASPVARNVLTMDERTGSRSG